jgi:hypothetical protein
MLLERAYLLLSIGVRVIETVNLLTVSIFFEFISKPRPKQVFKLLGEKK